MGDLPGDGILDIKEAGEFGGVFEGLRHAQLVGLEDLGLDGDALRSAGGGGGDVVATYYDVVGVEGLSDADGGGSGGFEVDGEAEVVEGELAVVTGDGEEAGRVEALVEGVGEGVGDPGEGWVGGFVFEGEDEDEATGWCGVGSLGRR